MTHPSLPIRDSVIITCVIIHGANRCVVRMPMSVLAGNTDTQAIKKDDGTVKSIFPVYVAVMHVTYRRLWRLYGVVL
jgi:hypothetical protein